LLRLECLTHKRRQTKAEDLRGQWAETKNCIWPRMGTVCKPDSKHL
jgi:hypothetical protein